MGGEGGSRGSISSLGSFLYGECKATPDTSKYQEENGISVSHSDQQNKNKSSP